ncbi:iron ABC transporter substrate-binding protein [Bacteroidia bacterium]|nr:iron ABC transporter substrate-binding protein [Bacteroidia bacterium]
MNKIQIFIILCLFFVSCQKSGNGTHDFIAGSDSIYYARGFQIETHIHFKLVQIKNPWHSNKRLQTYILVPKTEQLPEQLPEGIVIRTPLEKTVVFSAVVCGMLNELDVLSSLVGVAEPQYINIPSIRDGIANGTIHDVGQADNPNIEKLMMIEPEVLFTNPVNEAGSGSLGKLTIPAFSCLEWMENDPLGQAEWIRLIGLLFDKEALADSLFFETVRSYNALKEQTATVHYRPTVFAEKKYGDFWYMPGGKSYFAHLLEDAGADYVFRDNENTGSIPYSFETILDQAGKADYWLFKYYSAQDMTYKQLAAGYANYTLFDAYKKQHIYVCNTLKTPDYYQELPLHPDWTLKDLIKIFHPELLPEYQPRYYYRMTE